MWEVLGYVWGYLGVHTGKIYPYVPNMFHGWGIQKVIKHFTCTVLKVIKRTPKMIKQCVILTRVNSTPAILAYCKMQCQGILTLTLTSNDHTCTVTNTHMPFDDNGSMWVLSCVGMTRHSVMGRGMIGGHPSYRSTISRYILVYTVGHIRYRVYRYAIYGPINTY